MEDYIELFQRLSRLQWLLGRYHLRIHNEHGPFSDPTRGQGRVLALLKMQPEISTKELSYLLGIRQQSLNELLNKLEKGGYVVRTPAESDRRIMMVRLTEKGKNEQQPERDYSDIFSCLTTEEQAAFADYLDRITARLEAQLGAEGEEQKDDWINAIRERVGDEKFQRIMSMRGGFYGYGPGPHGDFWGMGHDRHDHRHRHPPGPDPFDPHCGEEMETPPHRKQQDNEGDPDR